MDEAKKGEEIRQEILNALEAEFRKLSFERGTAILNRDRAKRAGVSKTAYRWGEKAFELKESLDLVNREMNKTKNISPYDLYRNRNIWFRRITKEFGDIRHLHGGAGFLLIGLAVFGILINMIYGVEWLFAYAVIAMIYFTYYLKHKEMRLKFSPVETKPES